MIQQATVLSNGVSGNFWVTERLYVLPDLTGVEATLNLYVSRSAYVAGNPPIDQRVYLLNGSLNPVGMGAVKGLVENELVGGSFPDFVSGAVVS